MIDEEKKAAYKIVFDDLCNIGLFTGKYDGANGNEHFMYGVSTVMEFIAMGISEDCYNKFDDSFIKNMLESERKVRGGVNTRNTKKETTFDDYLEKQLKDPEFRKEWEKLCDDIQEEGIK